VVNESRGEGSAEGQCPKDVQLGQHIIGTHVVKSHGKETGKTNLEYLCSHRAPLAWISMSATVLVGNGCNVLGLVDLTHDKQL